MKSKTILLTGFEPFGGETINPSWEVAKALDGAVIAGHQVHARVLPCVFGEALVTLAAALREVKPALALALGQAGGRSELSLERVAINVDDARIPDNAGAQPIDEPVIEDGPDAYFTSLPIKAMVLGLREAGFPAGVSQTAGTFVCNHVFYGLMHVLAGRGAGQGKRGGFMHIPYLPQQAARLPNSPASMSLAAMVEGVRLALELAVNTGADLRLSAGAED